MKKIFYSLLLVAATLGLASCEDVPAPFELMNNGSSTIIEPQGDGTLANPYNIAGINKVAKALATGATSEQAYYFKGKVVSFKAGEEPGNSYGNATFYISDDGTSTKQFYCYRVLGPGNKNFTSSDQLKEGDEVIMYGKVTNYNGTLETVQKEAYVYAINANGGEGDNGDNTKVDPAGDGTETNPYNVAAAIAFTSGLAADTNSDPIYIKGYIVGAPSIDTGSYGNATFYIADVKDGSTKFYVFRCFDLKNQKFTNAQAIKDGDEVVIYGPVVNYRGNTPETVASKCFLVSINGEGTSGDNPNPDPTPGEAKGDGTETSPYNVAAALAYINTLTKDDKPEALVYTKGKICEVVKKGTSGSIQFKMSDNGEAANSLLVYYCDNLGKQPFANLTDLKVGDEVIVCGKVVNYSGNTPEYTSGAYLVSLNGKTEAEGGDNTGDNTGDKPGDNTGGATGENLLANGDFESWTSGTPDNWKSTSTASSATLTQSSDSHGGSHSVSIGFDAASNKRLAYKELTLAAGTYTYSFYAKATTSDASQCQAGYVPIVSGKVGTYKYGGYVTLNNNGWTLVSMDITLESESTICLVVMNPKTSSYATSQAILVDDATLIKK